MKLKNYIPMLLFACAINNVSFASSNIVANDTRYDVRYYTNNKRQPDSNYQSTLRKSASWKKFSEINPSWKVLFNEESQKPVIAYGDKISVPGVTIQDRALNFINTYLLPFNIPLADLSLKSASALAEKYDHVNFFQTYKGLEVIDSRVKIKMTKAGEVISFKTDVFSDIKINISPSISEVSAISYAKNGFAETITNSYAKPLLKILPIPGFRKYDYHLVYEVYIETFDEINKVPANYYTLVDASNGKILSRKNLVDHFAPSPVANVTVNGTLYPTHPYNPTQVLGLPYLTISSGTNYYTDATGVATGVPTGNATLLMEGPWCDVRTASTTPSMSSNISGNPTVSFDANSTDRERTAFYHINIIHDFVKAQPQLTGFTAMDFPMQTIVDVSGSCNAFYNGNVNFYASGGGCNATALLADVMYHEYGHGLCYDVYSYYGQTFNNGAMGEGYSDIWACSITNNPEIGIGFYTANQSGIRRYDPPNRKIYPQDLVGEVHADGEIIAGAWWEVNLNMNSLSFMTNLFINTFSDGVTGPDGNEGVIFTDVLIAALEADDTDGNICNGTPNSTAILQAFSAHGITLFTNMTVNHTPVTTANSNTTINITANVSATSSVCTLQGGTLYYRTDNSQPWTSSPMTYSNPTLSGSIPGQPDGTIVQYYFEVGGIVTPGGANLTPANIPYYILVGFTPNPSLYDDLGDASSFGNWNPLSFGNTSGTWTIDIPTPSYLTSGDPNSLVQVGNQVTSAGSYCAITSNPVSPCASTDANCSVGNADVDGGLTSIESPSFSLSGFTNPAITYYRAFSNSSGANPGNDPWKVEISNDNGNSWVNVEFTYVSDKTWRRYAFKVLDYTTLASQMIVRFNASDSSITALPNNGQSLVEAALDEFQIWDGPLPTTGLDNYEIVSAIDVYPNPASGAFSINFKIINEKEITIEMCDAIGQTVFNHNYGKLVSGNYQYTIETNLLSTGIYQINIKTTDGTISKTVSVVK